MAFFVRALPARAGSLLLALSSMSHLAAAINVDICGDVNTASMASNTSSLQSNGLCSDFCRSQYAYAITAQENCWCSNYAPDASTSQSDCNFPCLGYPFEYCGSKDNMLFSYLKLVIQPSGTKGAGSSTSNPSKTTSSIVQTVTVGGKVTTQTVIVTPSATDDPSKNNKPVAANGSGLGGGAIAGIVVGALAGIALIGLLIFFLLRRRKQNEEDEFRDDPSIRGSSRGRMGSHQHDLSIAGSAASPGSAGNRSSMLQVDPRMDPFKQGLYMRPHGSAESINTLRDEHDYSRRIQAPKVLRATNPDPDQ